MRKLALVIIIASLYAITAELSQFLTYSSTVVTPVWPPAGIALAAVLLFGNLALIAIFIGCFVANFHMFTMGGITVLSILYGFIPGIGGALQAYVGKFALVFFTGDQNIFKSTRSILVFIFISAFAACLINASLGTSTLVLAGITPAKEFLYDWITWWIADSVGVVTVTSTIVAWSQNWHRKISFKQAIKLLITWASILILGHLALHHEIQLAFLFIPFAIWSAFQFDIRYSLLTGLLISSVCLLGTVHGYGLIHPYSVLALLLVQIFISVIYLTILLIDAILSDRQKAYDNLQLLNSQLEQRILDRTKDLSETNTQLEVQKNKAMQAFEALKQSHARLMQSEKMASLGILTAGVAHEIKNPLNAVLAHIKSIKDNIDHMVQAIEKTSIDADIKKEVNRVNDSTGSLISATDEGIKRTTGVIADLCAFARSDEPEMVLTDLHRNIDSTLNLLSSEIKGNVTVVKEFGDIPQIVCHPGKINQVMMNILINAIHALQTKHDGKIIIKTSQGEDWVVVSIKDNAGGMKKEVLDKIFVPFFTTKQSGMGSGLGLFISNNIIKEHGGNISVMSELGEGTEFIITLPSKRM